jgi:hypothetical protein
MTPGHSPVRALAALAIALAGCLVDSGLGDSRLVCSDGRCPGGFTCEGGLCRPEGEGAASDASAPVIDAAGPPDASPPDGAPLPDAALPSCEQQYGAAPSFLLCVEQADSCEFFLATETPQPCAQHCAEIGGGDCIVSFNADNADKMNRCVRQDTTGCDDVNMTQICVCSRSPAR